MMQACGEDGPKSVADKFAELEARCAALAAENAGLKAAHPQPFGPEMMKALDAYEKYQDETPETGMLDAFFILRDSIRVDTTATEAVLAEVRARGVAMFSDWLIERIHGWQLEGVTPEDLLNFHQAVTYASEFAAQLRKGVQS
ncbi:TPA: hypothetical protein ACXDFA_001012 [Enterobacter roggenkampii]